MNIVIISLKDISFLRSQLLICGNSSLQMWQKQLELLANWLNNGCPHIRHVIPVLGMGLILY